MARDIERGAAFRTIRGQFLGCEKDGQKPANALAPLGRSSHAAGQSGDGERQSTTTAPAQARPAYAAPPPDLSTNPAFAQSRIKPKGFCRSRLDIGLEDLSVHRRVDNEGRIEAITAQSGDESLRLPVSERRLGAKPLALQAASAQAGDLGRGAGLVEEDQPMWLKLCLMGADIGHATVNVRLNREIALVCDLS